MLQEAGNIKLSLALGLEREGEPAGCNRRMKKALETLKPPLLPAAVRQVLCELLHGTGQSCSPLRYLPLALSLADTEGC